MTPSSSSPNQGPTVFRSARTPISDGMSPVTQTLPCRESKRTNEDRARKKEQAGVQLLLDEVLSLSDDDKEIILKKVPRKFRPKGDLKRVERQDDLQERRKPEVTRANLMAIAAYVIR